MIDWLNGILRSILSSIIEDRYSENAVKRAVVKRGVLWVYNIYINL